LRNLAGMTKFTIRNCPSESHPPGGFPVWSSELPTDVIPESADGGYPESRLQIFDCALSRALQILSSAYCNCPLLAASCQLYFSIFYADFYFA
jgi:hypothetical protein